MDILFTKKVPKDILSLHEDKPYHKKYRNVHYLFISVHTADIGDTSISLYK